MFFTHLGTIMHRKIQFQFTAEEAAIRTKLNNGRLELRKARSDDGESYGALLLEKFSASVTNPSHLNIVGTIKGYGEDKKRLYITCGHGAKHSIIFSSSIIEGQAIVFEATVKCLDCFSAPLENSSCPKESTSAPVSDTITAPSSSSMKYIANPLNIHLDRAFLAITEAISSRNLHQEKDPITALAEQKAEIADEIRSAWIKALENVNVKVDGKTLEGESSNESDNSDSEEEKDLDPKQDAYQVMMSTSATQRLKEAAKAKDSVQIPQKKRGRPPGSKNGGNASKKPAVDPKKKLQKIGETNSK